jgi:SpoVK/Ycf46/Vps4 family AAA+-type ATPase
VDTALRRPGRLDRTLLVLPPDKPAREAMLRYHLGQRPVEPNVDLPALAAKTDGFSGADMAHLVESAAEVALEDSLKSGEPRRIAPGDFQKALKEIKPSVRPWFETARNYALFANEGGAYDDLAAYLRAQKML